MCIMYVIWTLELESRIELFGLLWFSIMAMLSLLADTVILPSKFQGILFYLSANK